MKKLLVAALFASSALVSSGVANADPCFWTPDEPPHLPEPECQWFVSDADCGYNSVAQETVTGGQDTFTGVAYGYALSQSPGGTVSVRCEVRVNGAAVSSTPTGSGTPFATTQGQVTYTASDTDDVDLCTVWTDGADSGEKCADATTTQIPPQAVIDLLDSIFDTVGDVASSLTSIVDPTVCPALASLAPGIPGLIDINSQGDVWILGVTFWDCPPYDL